jgi:hypothetical protein
MKLECRGVFVAPFVPVGWAGSREGERTYALESPNGDSAIHISVYTREPRPITGDDAHDMLHTFLTKSVGTTTAQIDVIDRRPDEQRAFSRFSHALESGAPAARWYATCIVWPEHMLMGTYIGTERQLAEGEKMLSSIVRPGLSLWSRLFKARS